MFNVTSYKKEKASLFVSKQTLVRPLLLKKVLAEITVLIRIKEEFSVLETKMWGICNERDDAICAKSSEQLILELSATRFTDFGWSRLTVNIGSSDQLKTIWWAKLGTFITDGGDKHSLNIVCMYANAFHISHYQFLWKAVVEMASESHEGEK